jgi:hypothetical protein
MSSATIDPAARDAAVEAARAAAMKAASAAAVEAAASAAAASAAHENRRNSAVIVHWRDRHCGGDVGEHEKRRDSRNNGAHFSRNHFPALFFVSIPALRRPLHSRRINRGEGARARRKSKDY